MLKNARRTTGAPPEHIRQAQLRAALEGLADQGDTVHTESKAWTPEPPPDPIPAVEAQLEWDGVDAGPDFKVDASKVKAVATGLADYDPEEEVLTVPLHENAAGEVVFSNAVMAELNGEVAFVKTERSAQSPDVGKLIIGPVTSESGFYGGMTVSEFSDEERARFRGHVVFNDASGPEENDWNMDMDQAPDDGTVVEAVGRYEDAKTGFPRYVRYHDGAWYDSPSDLTRPLVVWAWRPRSPIWPKEPRWAKGEQRGGLGGLKASSESALALRRH